MSSQHEQSQRSMPSTKITLADRLERCQARSPTSLELLDFNTALDIECLLRSKNTEADDTISSGTLIDVTLYLSGPLLQWRGSDSGRFRNLQLRGLVAALALLHHHGLSELSAEPYDRLRINIANRFNDIVDGRRDSQISLEDRMRKDNALYLIRLAAQYFSLLKRAQPLSDALSIPIIGLALAGASIVSTFPIDSFHPLTAGRRVGSTTACTRSSNMPTMSLVCCQVGKGCILTFRRYKN